MRLIVGASTVQTLHNSKWSTGTRPDTYPPIYYLAIIDYNAVTSKTSVFEWYTITYDYSGWHRGAPLELLSKLKKFGRDEETQARKPASPHWQA